VTATRFRNRREVITLVLIVLLAALLFAGSELVGLIGPGRGHHRDPAAVQLGRVSQSRQQQALTQPACQHIPASPLVGVAVKAPVGAALQQASVAAHAHFTLAEFYVRFGSAFPHQAAAQAVSDGAAPVIQWNPRTAPIAAIAHGQYDGYLQRFATEAIQFHCRIVLSFAHEMNGTWYPWGCQHVSAKLFVAAWRHIVTLMRVAKNITWMWTTNVVLPGEKCSVGSRWPGAAYVDWVGVDGYLRRAQDTFGQTFRRTLAIAHRLAHGKPVLLSETGVNPGRSQPRHILAIYQGAAQYHLAGVIYFDTTGKLGNYQPQVPASQAAFQRGLRIYLRTG
jgi:hypothetical protein